MGLVLAAVLILSLAVALLAATGPEEGVCAFGLCANPDHVQWYVAIAAIVGLLVIMLLRAKDGVAVGAGVVLLGLAAIVALEPRLGAGGGSSPSRTEERGGDWDPLPVRLDAIRKAAETEEGVDERLPVTVELTTTNHGLAGLYFTTGSSKRLRFDLSSPDPAVDPFILLARVDEAGERERLVELANDDGGGPGADALIEIEVEAGRYYLDMRNYAQEGDDPEVGFVLTITESSLDSLDPDHIVRLDLGEGSTPVLFEGLARTGKTLENRYRIDVATGGAPACLILDVQPRERAGPPRFRDTKLALLDSGFYQIDRNDDITAETDLGSRIIYPTPSGADDAQTYVADVSAYADNTAYDLYIELAPAESEGVCVGADEFRRKAKE